MFKKIYQYLKKELWGSEKDWQPAKETIYYGLMTDEEIADMRKRNEAAMAKSNKVVRNDG